MKRTLLAMVSAFIVAAPTAQAADMALKAPPPPAPVATWTGCYFGANVGGASTRQSQYRVDQLSLAGTIVPAPFNYGAESDSSIAGGGQIGCDYQFAPSWVIGVQGMFDWTDLNGSHPSGFFTAPVVATNMFDRTRNFDTATARLGYAFGTGGNALAYVKGGAAWTRNFDQLIGTLAGGATFLSESATWNATGWTAGGGIEYRFAPNWSLFAEYDYLGFGTKTIFFAAPPGLTALGEHISIKQNIQAGLAGINYRFNWMGH